MRSDETKATSRAPSTLPIGAGFGRGVTAVPGPGTDAGADPGATMSTAAPCSSTAAPASRRPRRRQQPPLPDGMRHKVDSFAKDLRAEFGIVDRQIGQRLARRLCSLITPRSKCGRPMTETVATAIGLRRKGWAWSDIYPVAIPGFSNMEFYEQSFRKYNLRDAVRAYQRRRRKRKSLRAGGKGSV
jgi:hypothetical protein